MMYVRGLRCLKSHDKSSRMVHEFEGTREVMTPHMIEHIGDVALNNHDNKGYMKDVLHVPTITKNLVSVGQIVEQGMQVRFH